MAKNVATDQTRLLFITTARGNADTALPRGRRSVRRAIRLVHGEAHGSLHVPDRSNRRITLRYPRRISVRRRRVSREFLCACVGSRASTDAVLPRVHRSVGPGSGSLNVWAFKEPDRGRMLAEESEHAPVQMYTAGCTEARRRFSRLARRRPTLRCGANTEAWSFGCIWPKYHVV